MEQEKDDLQYKDLIKDLNKLQEVKAPKNFEADLMRRINSEDFSKEEIKSGFWASFISPGRLIPIGALAAVMIALLFVINNKPNISDDPLLAAPRERTDLISSNDVSFENYIREKKEATSSLKKDENESGQVDQKDSDNNGVQGFADKSLSMKSKTNLQRSLAAGNAQGNLSAPVVKASFAIIKSGLNFRQVNLSKEEKQVVHELKEKLINSYQKQ